MNLQELRVRMSSQMNLPKLESLFLEEDRAFICYTPINKETEVHTKIVLVIKILQVYKTILNSLPQRLHSFWSFRCKLLYHQSRSASAKLVNAYTNLEAGNHVVDLL